MITRVSFVSFCVLYLFIHSVSLRARILTFQKLGRNWMCKYNSFYITAYHIVPLKCISVCHIWTWQSSVMSATWKIHFRSHSILTIPNYPISIHAIKHFVLETWILSLLSYGLQTYVICITDMSSFRRITAKVSSDIQHVPHIDINKVASGATGFLSLNIADSFVLLFPFLCKVQ